MSYGPWIHGSHRLNEQMIDGRHKAGWSQRQQGTPVKGGGWRAVLNLVHSGPRLLIRSRINTCCGVPVQRVLPNWSEAQSGDQASPRWGQGQELLGVGVK